jgi:hypothetical protein
MQGPRFVRTTFKSQILHNSTATLYLESRDIFVSCLPLVYKRRRWPPSQKGGDR